jgi:hypothetical protein
MKNKTKRLNKKRKVLRKRLNKKIPKQKQMDTLALVPERTKHMICSVMDYKDESLVMAQLSGETDLLDILVYHFPQKVCNCAGGYVDKKTGCCSVCGKKAKNIYGFTVQGAQELMLRRGHLQIWKPELTFTTYSVVASVNCVDLKRNVNIWKSAEQMRVMAGDNQRAIDRFAVAKAVSKATRNAILAITPIKAKFEFLNVWKKVKGHVLTLGEKDAPTTIPSKVLTQRKQSDFKIVGKKAEQVKETEQVVVAQNEKKPGEFLLTEPETATEYYRDCEGEGCGRKSIGKNLWEKSQAKFKKNLCWQCFRKEELKKDK